MNGTIALQQAHLRSGEKSHQENHPLQDLSHISENHISAFLGATSPCYLHFPTDMREAAREYLERSLACGELTPDNLVEFERIARENALLRD